MKFLLSFFLIASLSASAQNSIPNPKTVNIKNANVVNVGGQQQQPAKDSTIISLAMQTWQWEELINLIRTADERPSVLSSWISFMVQNLKIVQKK